MLSIGVALFPLGFLGYPAFLFVGSFYMVVGLLGIRAAGRPPQAPRRLR